MTGYADVCSAKTADQMRRLFDQVCAEVAAKFGCVDRAIQRHNVGYFSGYFDTATMRRVADWLDAPHPIFGRPDGEIPATAIAKGREAARAEAVPPTSEPPAG